MPKLTEHFLAALCVDKDSKDRLVFDTVSPGLSVRVTAKGTRRFIVQWTDPVTATWMVAMKWSRLESEPPPSTSLRRRGEIIMRTRFRPAA